MVKVVLGSSLLAIGDGLMIANNECSLWNVSSTGWEQPGAQHKLPVASGSQSRASATHAGHARD